MTIGLHVGSGDDMPKSKFVVDLVELSKGLCKDCREFIEKYKPWDESEVPRIAQVEYTECKKCRMSYSIYKGMVWPIHFMNP